ncbi:hypothetical protein BP6252_02289 [Coleophoma cylindrospora]|uniref:Uncharacterized protein n=1 Tax=Coleophoma cylindrospora TaxID=1849047 RepID=A0A3D8SEF8_9HELO|nr:hypothetical protein BP6252_02289 [Coleophoma cylindrospora]
MTKSRARQHLATPAPCTQPTTTSSSSSPTNSPVPCNHHLMAMEYYDQSRTTLIKALAMVERLSKEVESLSLENERLLRLLAIRDAEAEAEAARRRRRTSVLVNLHSPPASPVCDLPELFPPVLREEMLGATGVMGVDADADRLERGEAFDLCDAASEYSDASEDLEYLLMAPGCEEPSDDLSTTRATEGSERNLEGTSPSGSDAPCAEHLDFGGGEDGDGPVKEEEREQSGMMVFKYDRHSPAQQLQRRYRVQRWRGRVVTV